MKDHVEGAKLADGYTELCKNAVGYMKAMEEYNPALMNTIGKWLKDNNITVDNRSGSNVNELANEFKALPFPEEQQDDITIEKQL
jgi:hypothetical protein